MDILLTNEGCTTLVAGSASPNVGADPVEVFAFSNEGPDTTFGVILLRASGPDPGLLKTVLFGSGPSLPITIDEFDTGSGSSFGHNNTRGGLGVGAAFYAKTPAFGASRPQIRDFSSAGGVPILFDTRGNRLAAPAVRPQPGITAVDGTDSASFGSNGTTDGGFPGFFGTSAAAAHAAGVAALMKDLVPTSTPDRIYGALQETAIDMDDPGTARFDTGFDFGTGHGLIQAVDALPSEPPIAKPHSHLGADSALTMTDSPDPVVVGGLLTYTITVTNNGPSEATGVTVFNDDLLVGARATFVSASPGCEPVNEAHVDCNLGNLPVTAGPVGPVTLDIVVTPNSVNDEFGNVAIVSAESPTDPHPDDNRLEELTQVVPPPPTTTTLPPPTTTTLPPPTTTTLPPTTTTTLPPPTTTTTLPLPPTTTTLPSPTTTTTLPSPTTTTTLPSPTTTTTLPPPTTTTTTLPPPPTTTLPPPPPPPVPPSADLGVSSWFADAMGATFFSPVISQSELCVSAVSTCS